MENYYKYDKIRIWLLAKFWKLIEGDKNEMKYSSTIYFKDNCQSMLCKRFWEKLRPINLKKRGNIFQ